MGDVRRGWQVALLGSALAQVPCAGLAASLLSLLGPWGFVACLGKARGGQPAEWCPVQRGEQHDRR